MHRTQFLSRSFFGVTLVCLFALPTRADAVPLFGAPSNAPFDPQPCSDISEEGCWTNYLRVVDYDGDFDLDVVMVNYSGFFESGIAEPLVVYRNDGSGDFSDVSAAAIDGYTAKLRQVAFGDIDADGDLDLFAPNGYGEGDALFVNDDGVFTDEIADRMPEGTSSRAGATRFGDFDGDRDLDLFVATGYDEPQTVWGTIYANDGTGVFALVDGAIPASEGSEDPDDVDLFDADNDFDLDILLNMHSGNNKLFLNEGDGTFVDASDRMDGQPNLYHYNPATCDVDGDGDLDVWVDNMGPEYTEQLLVNQGDGTLVDETADRVSMNPEADDNGVVCADVDLDGDFDAIVISLGPTERLLENDGDGRFTLVDDAFEQAVLDPSLWGEVGDLDGDGRLELVTGQGEQGDWTNKIYPGLDAQPVDDRGPAIRAAQAPTDVGLGVAQTIRFGVTDRDVSDGGPRVRRVFGRSPAWAEEIDAVFVGGDLFALELPGLDEAGTVEVTLCAIDLAGNEGCGEPLDYAVDGEVGTGSGDDTQGSEATGPTDDGDDATSADVEGDGSGSTDGDGGQDDDSADGCACRTLDSDPRWSLMLVLGAASFGLRRRRP